MRGSLSGAAEAYLETQVRTASPGRLVLMLYDIVINNVNQAQAALETNDIALARQKVSKAQDALTELESALNMDVGELSRNLLSLYDFCIRRLGEALSQKSPSKMGDVASVIGGLRAAWAEII